MSQLVPLLLSLQESGAERVFFSPNEPGLALDADTKRPLPGGPVTAKRIHEAVSEVLSHDDIDGLTGSRPRVVRHEHDGVDYVLEVTKQPAGVALGIRQDKRAGKPRSPQPFGAAPRNDVPKPPPSEPDFGRSETKPVLRRADAQDPVASRAAEAAKVAAREASERSAQDAKKASDESARSVAAEVAREVAREAEQTTRKIAEEAARKVAEEAARKIAEEAARKVAEEAARKVAEEIALEVSHQAARVAHEAARAVLAESGAAAAKAPPKSKRGRASLAPPPASPPRLDNLLREMLDRKASDLHLTAGSCPVLRVDGEIHFLRERGELSSEEILAMVHEVATRRGREDFEARNDADFAYEIPGLARFRVNVFRDRVGVGAVLRQIPIEILSAEKLGLPKACIDLCWLTKGLVLVTGPTGSGKSTTLAAMIDFINKNRSDHIITIEDPVEFVHKNQKCLVNQREVGLHTDSFKNALRAALREDPDIVLVGEMRDLETISIAIETAETGHLVFGTLHTTTAVSTIDRIIDQFPSDRQDQIRVMLSESLKGVVAQVLLPKQGGGRVAAHEILIGTTAVSALVRDGKTFQLTSVMQTGKSLGMVTMNDSLFSLVQRKLVDPKQAYLKAVDKAGFASLLKNAGLPVPV